MEWHAASPPHLDAHVWLQEKSDGVPHPVRVLSLRRVGRHTLILLEGVTDRTAAATLHGARLLMRREDLPELEDDEAYTQDLLGCDVLLANGNYLGRLDHVEYPAGQEVWAIQTPEGCEVLFPARSEYIMQFAKDRSVVVINPPEGLVDIYRS